MAGTIGVNVIQLGDSSTDSQNFVLKTNIDGTAKLARGSTGNLGDILTISSTGVVNLPGNIVPAFSAYCSTAQSIPGSTTTKVLIDTKEFDTNTNFDVVTNHRLTPTVAGYYQINWQVSISSSTATTRTIGIIYKNGSVLKTGTQTSTNGTNVVANSGSSLVHMNGTTDYLELYVFHGSGSAQSLTYYSVLGDSNYMNGILIARG